jgi:hypothetical protein
MADIPTNDQSMICNYMTLTSIDAIAGMGNSNQVMMSV